MLWNEIIKKNKLYFKPKTNFGEKIRKDIKKFVYEYCSKSSPKKINYQKFKLSQIHLFLVPEKIPELQDLLQQKFIKQITEWIMFISEDHLKMKDEYYVDQKFYFRINFPYDFAAKSTLIDKSHPLSKYNKGLPKAVWSHGPHIDTWYGHSFNAINFWWNIGGANKDNSMSIHLKKDTSNFPCDEFMYLDKNFKPPYPYSLNLKEGELLLFNSEQLHATRLNTSKNTRFVITVRVIQNQPTFDKDINHHHYLDWMSSKKIKKGDFSTKKYPNYIKVKKKKKTEKKDFKTKELKISFNDNKYFKISKHLEGKIIQINYTDKKILLTSYNKKYYAFNSLCPHLGVNLRNGFIINKKVKCPAHGAEFNLTNGHSGCKLKMKVYKVKTNTDGSRILITN